MDFAEMNPDQREEIGRIMKDVLSRAEKDRAYAKRAYEAVKYVMRITESLKVLMARTNQSDEDRFIFIPKSQALCGLPEGLTQKMMQNLWKDERERLWKEYRINNIRIVFYDDGDPFGKETLSVRMGAYADKLNENNTVVFLDGNKNDTSVVPGGLKGRYLLLWDKADKEGGYLSVGGHVGLALGVLDLKARFNNGVSDPDYLGLVLACAKSLGVDAAQLSGITTPQQLIDILKDGRLIVRLPRITKVDIDDNMRTFAASEEAAMKAV
jgi:hypothetical protein